MRFFRTSFSNQNTLQKIHNWGLEMDSTEDPYGFSATDAWEDQINKASSLPEGASVRHKHHAFGDVAQIR